MMYFAWYTPIQNGIASIRDSINGLWTDISKLVEGAKDFGEWIPKVFSVFNHTVTYIPAPFAIIAFVSVVIYVIKIIVGGDNS